jgi:glycosyltransferase involved in cell wall biosynthesis
MKKILILNDHEQPQGGADVVAIQQHKDFMKNSNIKCEFLSAENINIGRYEMKPKNFIKNIFNLRAYKFLRKKNKEFNPNHIIVHSWTKQLSSSIFLASRRTEVHIVAHDYFLSCPNGGLFNYVENKKCNLNGGGLKCVFTNCDKKSYPQKLYRLLRFYVQNIILYYVKPKVWCLNKYQYELLNRKFEVENYKNRINSIIQMIGNRDSVAYIGRVDPEKGVSTLENIIVPHGRKFLVIGPSQIDFPKMKYLTDIEFLGWIDKEKLLKIYPRIRILIFPSLWLEVDPLTPLDAVSFGIPVVSSIDNIFGIWLSKHLPELVYKKPSEINKILMYLEDEKIYQNICNKLMILTQDEKIQRDLINEKFNETFNR